MKKIHPLWTNFCWKGYAQWSKQILKNERLEKKNFERCFSYNNAVIQMSVNLIKADLQSSGLALGESFSFISDAFFIQMGKKVRVWICWRFHWLTVGTDKWGPPSFTIWPTATLFLIKCSILKGHVSTCLDPSKLDQDGGSHIETSPLPGWGLLSLGSGKSHCLANGADTSQPCSYQPCTHPSPDCFGRNMFSGFSATGSPGSLFDCLDQLLCYHRLSTLPVRAVWKPEWC